MGLIITDPKTTFQPRPTIASTQKVTSAEYNALIDTINVNYQEFLDLQTLVDSIPAVLPQIEVSGSFTISSKGIYILSGGTGGTLTIDDAIVGDVIIRTIATATFLLSGNINSNHLGSIYEGTPKTSFLWNATASEYIF